VHDDKAEPQPIQGDLRVRQSGSRSNSADVRALHPDEMTPREALEALYALKARLPKTKP